MKYEGGGYDPRSVVANKIGVLKKKTSQTWIFDLLSSWNIHFT